ncbi:hypothetical protein A6764_18440 [Brevibacillus sp. WF146]|uniref:hypothetical protein n=1 Tax=Brevibacillus sp. WF146 TaxID=319501 RepID=UPI0007ED3C50|nr:hypothetical protein [Brevibacillus sp. WF146]UYZ12761.1 hypothetical protein A6764_18440 [Brevibacillus sp. WF146]
MAFDHDAWNKLNNPDKLPVGDAIMTIVAARTDYVATLPQSNPFAIDTTGGNLFNTMSPPLEQMRHAFALVKR